MTGLLALSLASTPEKEQTHLSTDSTCCTFYLSNLIAVQCGTVQYLPAQSYRWHSMHKITNALRLHSCGAPHLPSSHLSLKSSSSITWTPQPPKLRLRVLQFIAHGRKDVQDSKTPSRSRSARACLASSPSGSLVLVYFCRDMNAFGEFLQ